MNKKKKIILIALIAIVALAAVAISAYFIIKQINTNEEVGKLNSYYDKLVNTNSYTFSTTLDDQNKMYYAKQDKKAYVDIYYEGRNSKYIIKDGDTNLLQDDNKQYYTYSNNETELYKVELQIRDIKDNEAITGKEKIENKNYKYEEFKGLTEFYIGNPSNINEENVKTRFYFSGDKLVYIKTIIDENNQQILKVDFEDNASRELFEIPSDYKKM